MCALQTSNELQACAPPYTEKLICVLLEKIKAINLAEIYSPEMQEVAPAETLSLENEGEELPASPCIARIPCDEQIPVYRKEVMAEDNTGTLWPLEICILRVEDEASPVYGIFVQDVTGRMEAEQKAQESNAKFKSIVLNGQDVVGIYDASGTCTYMSPTVRQILGYEPEYFYQNSSYDLIHPDDYSKVVKNFSEFASGIKVSMVPYRYKHQNGEWRWMESYVTNLIEDPVIKGLVINSRDITERVMLQEELDRKSRLRQKELTAAVIKGQELERSQIGLELHDNINQILTTVKLYNEMILHGHGPVEKILPRSIEYLQKCINEIRNISKRLSAPTLGNISLIDSVKELVESVNLTQRLSLTYTIKTMNNTTISQDIHISLYRIVQEQLNNILKYSEATEARVHISLLDDSVLLRIEDNGKGFDTKMKSKGIGIANMKVRAEHLGGSFSLQSEPGQGCLLDIQVPLSRS